jgi:calcium-binding protein CML
MGIKPLTKQQLADLREIFLKFDIDGDGSLTELELGALVLSLGLNPTVDQITELLHKSDANNNGLIEFEEFVVMIGNDTTDEQIYTQEELLSLFRRFDRDGNGFISATELAYSMAKLGHPLTVTELGEMIREADMDGDGRISFLEFAAAMVSAASQRPFISTC